jgi:hypothetical protein
MRLPTFLFVGADKCGSTWLFKVLQQHPQCFVPAAKDIYFFDRYYGRGLQWYASFFSSAPRSARAIGELSHDYLYSEQAAERIASTLPEARLLVFLRHPVERTFSEYLYLVRSGLAPPDNVRSALAAHPDAIEHSRYANFLPHYLDRFPRDQIGIFFYEDLARDPSAFAEVVLSFLGAEMLDGIDYHERVLPVVGRVKANRIVRTLYVSYGSDRPVLDESDRHWLHSKLDPDLPALERLLGQPLGAWHTRTRSSCIDPRCL